MTELENKYRGLCLWISKQPRAAVALSGGIDSSLVLQCAVDALGNSKVLAITADSPSLARRELAVCQRFTTELKVAHVIIPTNELSDENYRKNLGQRCYFCKSALYQGFANFIAQSSLPAGINWEEYCIMDGTNADDLTDIRPGLRAAEEHNVLHPLVELGLGKELVRGISKWRGLKAWDKPEAACLASRIAHGVEVSAEKLSMVEEVEAGLIELGFSGHRVRYHELVGLEPRTLARIETQSGDFDKAADPSIRESAARIARQAGFNFIVLDIEGYRKGGTAGKIF